MLYSCFLVVLCIFHGSHGQFERMIGKGILDQDAGAGKILIQSELLIDVEYKPEHCPTTAENGDTLTLDFTCYVNGKEIESSIDNEEGPGRKLVFMMGKRMVLPGLEQGAAGMCLDEKRKVTIPSHLAFGAKGIPDMIPGGATVVFDIHLLFLEKKGWAEWYIDSIQMACIISFTGGMFALVFQKVQENRTNKKKKPKKED